MSQWHIVTKKKSDADALVQEVLQFGNSVRDVIWVFEMGHWRPDRDLWEAVQKASWDDVVLDPEFKKSVQNDYRTFFKSEGTYKRLNVPWKRGLIFLGPPGNGKTISLKAIMNEVKLPTLYVKTFTSA
jgi:SpoVK/Ycf46/Vps4 family AAA+-type ATPase